MNTHEYFQLLRRVDDSALHITSREAQILDDQWAVGKWCWRDMFIAVSFSPDEFVNRIQQRIKSDYKRMPYPISDSLFIVTQDGIAGTRVA